MPDAPAPQRTALWARALLCGSIMICMASFALLTWA